MTAPLFILPIVNPAAGGTSSGAAQGPVGGFEALLAAFFGETGEAAQGVMAEADPAAADKPAAADDPRPAAETVALPQDAMVLASLLTAQQPAQAAPPVTDAPADGEAQSPAAPPAPIFAPLPEQSAQGPAPDSHAKSGAPVPTQGQAAQASTAALNSSDPLLPADQPAADAPPATTQSQPAKTEPPAGAPRPETAQRAQSAKPGPAPQTQAPRAQVQSPVEAPAPKQEAATTAPAELATEASPELAHLAQPAEARPSQTRSSRANEGDRRHVSATHQVGQPVDDVAAQPAVKPVPGHALADAAASSEGENVPDVSTQQAKAQPADAPDFQPPAPAVAAQASLQAGPAAAPVRVTSETVANLTAEISRKLEGRTTKFEVELTPAGLGHVSVSVEIAASGKMTAAMSFDSPQAAAELRSRSHELQKALEQAGFDIAGGLSFDVNGDRGEGGRQMAQQQHDGAASRGRAFQAVLNVAGDAAETAATAALHYVRRTDAGVDIRI